MARALGVRWCLQKMKKLGLSNMVVRTDATVVERVYKKHTTAFIELVIQHCRELLNQLIRVFLKHIGRARNADAHNLVGLSKTSGDESLSQLCSFLTI